MKRVLAEFHSSSALRRAKLINWFIAMALKLISVLYEFIRFQSIKISPYANLHRLDVVSDEQELSCFCFCDTFPKYLKFYALNYD